MVPWDARVVVGPDSRIIEASDAALAMLGLTIDELRALPPGSMSLAEDRAAMEGFEAAWREAGAGPILGSGTVRLRDGRLLRLAYMLTQRADGAFELTLAHSQETVSEPARMYTVGHVLSAWRAAERRLATVPRDSAEWAAAQEEIERFRLQYQHLAKSPRAEAGEG